MAFDQEKNQFENLSPKEALNVLKRQSVTLNQGHVSGLRGKFKPENPDFQPFDVAKELFNLEISNDEEVPAGEYNINASDLFRVHEGKGLRYNRDKFPYEVMGEVFSIYAAEITNMVSRIPTDIYIIGSAMRNGNKEKETEFREKLTQGREKLNELLQVAIVVRDAIRQYNSIDLAKLELAESMQSFSDEATLAILDLEVLSLEKLESDMHLFIDAIPSIVSTLALKVPPKQE